MPLPALAAPIATGIAAGGTSAALGSVFGKKKRPKLPTINVTPLKQRVQDSIAKRQVLATDLPGQLAPIGEQFRTGIQERGQQFVGDVGARGEELVGQVANPALRAAFRNQLAKETFANVPAMQDAIRQQLGGSGLTGNAAAVARLADPTLQAARDVSAGQLQFDLAQEDARRRALQSAFGADVDALRTSTGADIGAEERLFGTGREDILRKTGTLQDLSAEQAEVLNALDLVNFNASLANARMQAASDQARRSGQFGLIGQVAPTLLAQLFKTGAAPTATPTATPTGTVPTASPGTAVA